LSFLLGISSPSFWSNLTRPAFVNCELIFTPDCWRFTVAKYLRARVFSLDNT
jgi:hypothetical protein